MAHFVFLGGSEMKLKAWEDCHALLKNQGHRGTAIEWIDADWSNGLENALADLARPIPKDAILIGHSLAGLILLRLAEQAGAAAEIYLAALTATPEQSLLDRLFAGKAIFTPGWETAYREISAGASPERQGEILTQYLFHDCPPGSQACWRPPGLALDFLYELRLEERSAEARMRHYVVCSDDRTIRPEWQRVAAAEINGEIWEISTGHCPHLAKPKEFVELLLKIV